MFLPWEIRVLFQMSEESTKKKLSNEVLLELPIFTCHIYNVSVLLSTGQSFEEKANTFRQTLNKIHED